MHHTPCRKFPLGARVLGAVGLGLAVAALAGGVAAGMSDAVEAPANSQGSADLPGAALAAIEPAPASAAPRRGDDALLVAPKNARVATMPGSNREVAKPSPAARVDLRCWQDGVLIVNERRLLPAVEPFPYVVKFPSREPGGVPVYVGAWATATCVIKPAAE